MKQVKRNLISIINFMFMLRNLPSDVFNVKSFVLKQPRNVALS